MNICTSEGCENQAKKKGLCGKHYMRLYRTGSTQLAELSTEDRFWQKVAKTETCWEWTGAKNPEGYGVIRVDNKPTKAHRYSYELATGLIPAGKFIDHKCHKPWCVNPDHLRPATHKQNLENHRGANRNSESGVRGVMRDHAANKWIGYVMHNRKNHCAGSFDTIQQAEAAVVALRNRLHTHNDRDRSAA